MEKIGKSIKAARKAAGLTQKELAQKLGISFQSVAQWENDLRRPKFETIQKIADALGVDWMDFGFVTTHERAEQARQRHKNEQIRNKAIPAIVDSLTAIYGQCDLTTIYELFEGYHIHENYYALNKDEGQIRKALEIWDMNHLTDIVIATTSAVVNAIMKDEISVQEKIVDSIDSSVESFGRMNGAELDFLKDIEESYENTKFKNKIAVNEIDWDGSSAPIADTEKNVEQTDEKPETKK